MVPAPHAPSYYAHSAHEAPPRPPLGGTVDADVCIVGAGYTGLSAGIALAEAGKRVVILEQSSVGWGASGRNGGQIVHSFSRDLDVIEAAYGRETAEPLGRMMFEGAAIIRERVKQYGIACDLKDGGAYTAIGGHISGGTSDAITGTPQPSNYCPDNTGDGTCDNNW